MSMPPQLPQFWVVLPAVIALSAGLWWVRRRQVGAQRRTMRAYYSLSEQIFAARSPVEIAEQLAATLPVILPATSVRLYVWNRRSLSLESVPTASDPEPMAVALEGSAEGLEAGAIRCFRDRALLNIADVRRNPLVSAGWKSGLPRSAIFAPLLAQTEALGVIAVGSNRRPGYFSPEEQATLQHLANQVAASLKLEEQQTTREQLFRSEKLAATGQLISGVANDLRAPLQRIQTLSSSALSADRDQIGRDLKQLHAEAKRASEIVSRLVSFARPEETVSRLVDVNALANGLMQFREPEWKTLGLRVQNRLSPEPAMVLGVEGQIEEMLLNLLVSAEQLAAHSAAKTLEITSSLIAGRVALEIHSTDDRPVPGAGRVENTGHHEGNDFGRSDLEPNNLEPSEANLSVCRAISQSHGGQLRVRRQTESITFDVDLPLAQGPEPRPLRQNPAPSGKILTLMLVDTEPGARRQLLGLLAARGHRVVPANAEEAADLAHRLRFDGVVWALRSAAWSDYKERLREAIPTFVLVSDAYDADLAATLEETGDFFLGRPVREAELGKVLGAVEARAAMRTST